MVEKTSPQAPFTIQGKFVLQIGEKMLTYWPIKIYFVIGFLT